MLLSPFICRRYSSSGRRFPEQNPPLFLLGTMLACIPMVPLAHWCLLQFQTGFLAHWRRHHLEQTTTVSLYMRKSLWWWLKRELLMTLQPLGPSQWTTITTDASKKGWRAHCEGVRIQVRWRLCAKEMVSNILEIWAAHLALTSLATITNGRPALLQMDNRAAVAYIQRQGACKATHS